MRKESGALGLQFFTIQMYFVSLENSLLFRGIKTQYPNHKSQYVTIPSGSHKAAVIRRVSPRRIVCRIRDMS